LSALAVNVSSKLAHNSKAPEENDSARPRRERNPIFILLTQDLTVNKIAGCLPPVHEDIDGSQTYDLSFSSALHALRQLDTINAAGFRARTSCISFEVPDCIKPGGKGHHKPSIGMNEEK
jgi:hypothetical protein